MTHRTHPLVLSTTGPGLYEFTSEARDVLVRSGIVTGLLTVFCQHTSASLTIQENADPDVQRDLSAFFKRLVPDGDPLFRHTSEGPDDMPAHVKAALTDVSLSVPIVEGTLALGTWQGLYLFEHRSAPHSRRLVLHMMGD
jgi:secondary thiamine-phosphate synthase enzyme